MAFFNSFRAFRYLASFTTSDLSLEFFSRFFCFLSILSRELPNSISLFLLCKLNFGNGNDFFTNPPPLYLFFVFFLRKNKLVNLMF